MTAVQSAFQLDDRPPLDRWLRLARPVQARYDEEHAQRRVAELRSAILFGLALYNIYNLTSIVLLPDVLVLSVVLRLAVVTPSSLALAWLIGKTSPRWTERLMTAGILNAYLVPVYLFFATQTPAGLFTFGELPLTILFANMVLALRFPQAVGFTVGALAASLAAVVLRGGLEPSLRFAFCVQIATACAFALYANYRFEKRRCTDFLVALEADLEAHSARADRQTFRDLSRTDALTQLPNRRHLVERLDGWLSDRRAMAVMMMDIDHFKLFNDALGHPAGDECLQRVSATLARIAAEREDAFCARFGGEEFTFALCCESEIEAARCARDIVAAISEMQIAHPSRRDGTGVLTVSVGVAYRSGEAPGDLRTILSAADRALYVAKQRGRNGFAFALEDEAVQAAR